jgi:Cft2 family RNA processing exonuclease
MRITNLNTDTSIGASSWFVEFEGHRLLLDAGMHPKREGLASLPQFSLVSREDVDAIVISHCHHDHVGSLPVAMRHFPRAHVLLTELSYFLAERVLHNSVNVMTRQRDELGVPEYPLYTHDSLDEMAPRFQGFKYNREIEWRAFHRKRSGVPSPTLEFLDAGHTLGSAGVLMRGEQETFFYTGDVCFHDQTLQTGACFEDVDVNVLLIETTRGGRGQPKGVTRESEVARLSAAISRRLDEGGSGLIPSFALGRTQEILALLALLMERGAVRRQPVYIGGLGRVFTEIYDLQSHRARRHHTHLRLTEALDLVVLEKNASERMKLSGRGKLFVVTAGMMSEHTPAHDLAVRMVGDPRQSILFVGYADPDTPAGRLKAAHQGETFFFSEQAGKLTRLCEIEDFDLTAHAMREDMLDFVSEVSPRVVLLGHGDDVARQWYEEQIKKRHPRMKVLHPGPGQRIEV